MTDTTQKATEAAVTAVAKAAGDPRSRLFLLLAGMTGVGGVVGTVYLFLIYGAPLIGCAAH